MEESSYELECLRGSVIPLLYDFHGPHTGSYSITGKNKLISKELKSLSHVHVTHHRCLGGSQFQNKALQCLEFRRKRNLKTA